MPRMKTLAAIALLASSALAANQKRQTPAKNNVNECPNHWELFSLNSQKFCCPGAVYGTNDNDDDDDNDNTRHGGADLSSAFCCVGADFQVATPSFASCFPFCGDADNDDDGDDGVLTSTTTQQACSTSIPLTASGYESLVSAAATSIGYGHGSWNGNGHGNGHGNGNGAARTTTGWGGEGRSTESATTARETEYSESTASASASSASSRETAAAARMTSGPMAGAVMVAGAVVLAF